MSLRGRRERDQVILSMAAKCCAHFFIPCPDKKRSIEGKRERFFMNTNVNGALVVFTYKVYKHMQKYVQSTAFIEFLLSIINTPSNRPPTHTSICEIYISYFLYSTNEATSNHNIETVIFMIWPFKSI